jgi:hypothetical protein
MLEARAGFRIAYGHTSHGSQIVSGMSVLQDLSDLYSYNHEGTGGALSLYDATPPGDLGNPDRTTWATRTRELLNTAGNDRNLIMWSWCGQASTATEADIDTYLDLMAQLEADYPEVDFVYMTGHLDGSGEVGNLNQRNNQIRDFVSANNRILFDFADIESYDPDGRYFLDLGADDACNYDGGNWADEWCADHPGECSSVSCAHSRSLNCDLKGRAFWWMMARLAGGDPVACTEPVAGLRLLKRGGDVDLSWEAASGVLGYNAWYVSQKSLISEARLSGLPAASGVVACSAPAVSVDAWCTDADAVERDAPGVYYYQLRTHCCGVEEGP